MNRIVEPLRQMGAGISSTGGCAPLRISPAPLECIGYELPVASAQVLSCLQIAALGAEGESRFTVDAPVRDHTSRMLRASAAFLFAAAAIVPGSRVTVTGVGVNPTRTGILDVLSKMGAEVSLANNREEMGEPVADVTLVAESLHGVEIAGDLVVRSIDEFPAIASVAAFAEGRTVVRDAEELRYKETDRIAAIVAQLSALGAEVEELEDGFAVCGGTLKGGTACANGDHRLAMSMAVCGLRAPVSVEGAEILNESFPDFERVITSLM